MRSFLLCVAMFASLIFPAESSQTCKPENARPSTPTTDFDDNRDGTVTHKRTGLTWMRCSLGQSWDGEFCAGKTKVYLWQQALQAAPDVNAAGGYAGHADWRLPNIKELDSIVETQCFEPSINLTVFPATPSDRFWSSTLSTSQERGYAWFVRFNDGYADDGTTVPFFEDASAQGRFAYRVRLVRGGQAFASFDAMSSPQRAK